MKVSKINDGIDFSPKDNHREAIQIALHAMASSVQMALSQRRRTRMCVCVCARVRKHVFVRPRFSQVECRVESKRDE